MKLSRRVRVTKGCVSVLSPPAAFQPPCCLPQPRTKHIAATEQHGILSYLPAAAAVLAPDAPVLSCTRCRRCAAAAAAGPAARSPPGARLGPQNVLYNHTSHLSDRHDPPAAGPGAPTLYLVLGLDLKRKC